MPILDKMIVDSVEMERIGPTFFCLSQSRTDRVSVKQVDHGMAFGSEDLKSRIKSANQRPTIFRLADYPIIEPNQNDRGVLDSLWMHKGTGFGHHANSLALAGYPLKK